MKEIISDNYFCNQELYATSYNNSYIRFTHFEEDEKLYVEIAVNTDNSFIIMDENTFLDFAYFIENLDIVNTWQNLVTQTLLLQKSSSSTQITRPSDVPF